MKDGAIKPVASTAKLDADDRSLCKPSTGEPFSDAGGSGKAAALRFATLDNEVGPTYADFLVA